MMPTLPFVGCACSHSLAALQVGHHAVVGHAALGPYLRGDVVRSAVPVPAVKVRTDHGVAVPGQPVGELAVELIPARHVVYCHDAGRDCSAGRPGDVSVNLIAVAARVGDHLGCDALC